MQGRDLLQEHLPETFQLDPKVFDSVLSVVAVEGKLRWHLHKAPSTYRQDVLLTRASQDAVSSAVQKLGEALTVLGLQLNGRLKAIDLGRPCPCPVFAVCRGCHLRVLEAKGWMRLAAVAVSGLEPVTAACDQSICCLYKRSLLQPQR